jgi:putative intracellular protease/amidase
MFAARNTRKLREIDYSTFDALFVPGGWRCRRPRQQDRDHVVQRS